VSEPLFATRAEAVEWAGALPEGTPGREIMEYHSSASSTQDLAFAAAERGAPGGAVFLAEEQSAGRGRQGAKWTAPPGCALLLSVLLSPAPAAGASGRVSLSAALAACRAVEKVCAAAPAIRWPNDLLLGGRKFGGILVEVRGAAAVLGLGVNVLQGEDDFPEDLTRRATSLAIEVRDRPDRRWLLGMLLVELGRSVGPGSEPWENLRLEVARRLAWRGRPVRVGAQRGTLTGIDADGRLLLEGEGGSRLAVASGSPELLDQ
jgi:BirA family biotin operon repressor/biotin-[acetyl-CoA-carboxylase] ligase